MQLKDVKDKLPKEFYSILDGSIDEFRPCQKKAIDKGLLERKNLLICTPTASGKTLTAELAGIGSILKGNCHHCFEGGVGGLIYWPAAYVYGLGDTAFSPLVRLGYRYTSRVGFQFRAFGNLSFYEGTPIPLPFLSVGYSF